MKKILFAFIALLLATTTQASLNDTRDHIIIDTAEIPFGNGTIKVMVLFNHSNATATIGTGYTACIPQDTEGKIHIPSTVKEEDTGIRYHVTAIAPMAFRFCTKLTDVEIDEGVTSIGNYAFIGCYNLETVSLPSTVTQIGDGAFCELPNLVAMKCARSSPPTWHWYDVFQKDGSNNGRNPELKLYVPSGSVSAYQNAKNDYSWTCMNTSTNPYSWGQTETRSQVGWGSYFESEAIRSLEQWDIDHCISIYTVDDLKAFRDKVNAGTNYRDYVVKLEADLDLSGISSWTPIGRVYTDGSDKYYDFYGTFDGQGHTISHLTVGDDDSYTSEDGHNNGLFGGTRNATVRNLIVENATIKGNWHVGTVIAHAQGATTVENVLVKNCNVTGRSLAGGIIGTAEDYSSDDCVLRMNGCVVKGGSVTSVFNVCYDGNTPFCATHPSWGAAGGLIGFAQYAWFTNCANLQTKVTWSSVKVDDSSLIEYIDRQVCRGALVGFQDKDVPTGQKSMAYCYAHLHSENSLTRDDYMNDGLIIYLDSYRLYGNPEWWGAKRNWSRDTDKVAVGNNDSNLKGMQLQTTLNTNNPGQWAYKYNELPWPGYFAYYAYGDTDANKVVYMPYNVFVDKPNYLTVDNASSVLYNDESNTFTAHSIEINENFREILYQLYPEQYLPINKYQITANNGFINPMTLSATSNGTQQVTTDYPVYVKDDENMPVLDPHGNPVQATNSDGSPKTESVTETVSLYTPNGYTLYLPYSTYLNSNCEVYEPATWDDNTGRLNFTRVENNQIQAYKPYYVLVKEGEVDLNANVQIVIGTTNSHWSTTSDNSFNLIGTLSEVDYSIVQTKYVLDNNNQWKYVPFTDFWTTVSPFSFYIGPNNVNPGNVTFDMNLIDNTVINLAVTGHGDNAGGWRFIASPVAEDIPPAAVENLEGVKYETGIYNYDLYRFNQSADLEWENYHGHDTEQDPFMLVNGQGYLYATKTDRTLSFRGTFNTDATKDVTLQNGFNLIGNPFNVPAYVNRSYYKMNAAGSDIEAVNEYTTNTIPVCTGIVVKATANNETVRFSKEAPVAMSHNNGSLQMTLTRTDLRSNEVQDKAIVSFNEGAELGKFIFNESHAKLYIPQNGEDYAIVFSEKNGVIPLNFKAKETGRYSIIFNFEDMSGVRVQLIDKFENKTIDNPTTYTFVGSSADLSNRFTLVFTNVETDGVFAYQSGNSIIVSGEGELQVFDVIGRMVKTQQINGVETISTLTQGVYILRVNGKTQKIVIR